MRVMKSRVCICLLMALLLPIAAQGAFLEITASEMATIQPPDSSASPRLLVKWQLPSGLDTIIIDGAGILMEVSRAGSRPAGVSVYPLITNWTSNSVAWSGTWENAGGDFDETKFAPALLQASGTAELKTDVTPVIKSMLAGSTANNGFIVIVDAGGAKLSTVSTANTSSSLAKAKLVIAYRKRR
jgi:hypothetical protein